MKKETYSQKIRYKGVINEGTIRITDITTHTIIHKFKKEIKLYSIRCSYPNGSDCTMYLLSGYAISNNKLAIYLNKELDLKNVIIIIKYQY